MEKRTKMSRNQKEGFAKRNPQQSLKGFQILKPKTSNLSSSSASSSSTSSSFEAPNGRSRSFSSSSSTTHPQRKPKTLPATSNYTPLKSSAAPSKLRSRENEVPKIPISQKSTKALQLGVDKKQCGKANRKPTIRNGQRSKLCSVQANPARNSDGKNGSGKIPIKLFVESNRTNSNCTPAGKTFTVSDLDSISPDYSQCVETDLVSKDTAVKTPPVEVSVSPEIQYGSHFKMPVMKSAATPICYGAGHLLSGVTDKRKCRRRGSLKGVCEKVNLFHEENVNTDSRDSLVPLPAEASIRWLSSPSNEVSENMSDQRNKEMHEDLLVISPNSVSECIENNSAVSLGSLSSGHIIQTPSSGSSSYGCLGGLKADVVQFELDSISETLNNVGSLPSCGSLKCADMDQSSSIGLSHVQENANSHCSWVSESTVENFALSQTRISWKDGVFSEIAENDEPDFFRCSSDEEIDEDTDFGRDRENVLALNSCLNIPAKGIAKLPTHGLNESAESIYTNGGNLVASGDSDRMYFPENRSF